MTAPPSCRSCEAPVIWARFPDGTPVMLDKTPSAAGLHAVTRDARGETWVRVLGPGDQPQPGLEHRHIAHFDTCSDRPPEIGDD